MIDRSNGIQVIHRVLETVLGTRVGLLFNSSRDKKKGKQYCQEKTAKELGWFNKDPESPKVIVGDANEFSEGVSFYGCVNLCIVNPPSSYSQLKQIYGRVLRSCRSNCKKPIHLFVCVAKSIDGLSLDEMQLEKLKMQRNEIEPAVAKLCQNAIASQQMAKDMGLREERVTSEMREKIFTWANEEQSTMSWLSSFITSKSKGD